MYGEIIDDGGGPQGDELFVQWSEDDHRWHRSEELYLIEDEEETSAEIGMRVMLSSDPTGDEGIIRGLHPKIVVQWGERFSQHTDASDLRDAVTGDLLFLPEPNEESPTAFEEWAGSLVSPEDLEAAIDPTLPPGAIRINGHLMRQCPECEGVGATEVGLDPNESFACTTCEGAGYLPYVTVVTEPSANSISEALDVAEDHDNEGAPNYYDTLHHAAQRPEECERCHGTGIWDTGNNELPCDCAAGRAVAAPPPRMFTCPGCGMEKQVQWTDPETSMALTRQPYIWCGNGPIMLVQCRGCGVLMPETQAMYCERCEPT
jgi:hypothetical protein